MGTIDLSSHPTIWKTKLRSALEGTDWRVQEKYCLDNSLVGIGWGINELPEGAAFEAIYEHLCQRKEKGWGKRAADTVRRLAVDAQPGDFVWTRNLNGRYRLCKITGPYRYVNDQSSIDADVHQIRDVQWAPDSYNDLLVPGGVVRNFVGTSSSFQRISDAGSRILTPALWDVLHGRPMTKLDVDHEFVLTTLLDMYDVEDLVYIWLQVERGCLAAPRSRERSTPVYEFTMIDRRTKRRAIVQVKTGDTPVDLDHLLSAADESLDTYAFATCGNYEGDRTGVTEVIEPQGLVSFANSNRDLLPDRIRRMFELAD